LLEKLFQIAIQDNDMNNKHIFTLALLLIFASGCVVPGLSTPAATPLPKSTPTADSLLPTLVAEKVYAALTQTAQALPPTSTPEPSTPTATVTATPPVGSSLTIQDDNSTFFIDERAGYTVFIPPGWLVVRPNQPEFLSALATYQTSDPLMYEALKKIEAEDQSVLRLFALNIQEKGAPGEPIATLKFILDETRGISFNSDQDLQALADELVKATPGMEVTAVDILLPPTGMQFGALESITDGDVTLHEKRVYFMSKTGMAYAWLTTGESLKATLFPAFDAIMDTLRLQ
jgi:hypothetical protein